jgi:hypothetical protein
MARKVRPGKGTPLFFCKDVILNGLNGSAIAREIPRSRWSLGTTILVGCSFYNDIILNRLRETN